MLLGWRGCELFFVLLRWRGFEGPGSGFGPFEVEAFVASHQPLKQESIPKLTAPLEQKCSNLSYLIQTITTL